MGEANQRRNLAADLAEFKGLLSRSGGWWDRLTLQDLGTFGEKAYREAAERAIAAEAEVERLRGILDAPVVALFADDRKPTENERVLLNLLSWRESEARQAKQDIAEMRKVVDGLAARVAGQAELLSRKAEAVKDE